MLTLGVVLFVTLLCCQGSSGGASGRGFQGGFITGANGAGTGVFPQGGPLVYPGGDPTKQQQHSHQSMTPGGSCLPLDHCAACPNIAAKGFRGPNGCYFCYCGGSHSSGTGNILPTPLIISAGTSQATSKPMVNNRTPPMPSRASPVTVAITGSTTSTPSSGQCQSAARLCLLNCPGGYLVDPNDCTFCVCKSNTIAGR